MVHLAQNSVSHSGKRGDAHWEEPIVQPISLTPPAFRAVGLEGALESNPYFSHFISSAEQPCESV